MRPFKAAPFEAIAGRMPWLSRAARRFPWIPQFINFGLVGVSNLAIAYFVYAGLVWFDVHPQIANLLSFFTSVANAYLLNRLWVFRSAERKDLLVPLRFFIVYGSNLLMGVVLLYLYLDVWHLNKYIAPFLALPVTVPANFLLNRFWVFKRT